MATIELDKIAKDISREALSLLAKTDVPALPPYYAKAFSDVARKYGDEIESELNKRLVSLDATTYGKYLEESFIFARKTLKEYSGSASRLKEIADGREAAFDLNKLESENVISEGILGDLKSYFSDLTCEVKKAEETIGKLESDLNKIEAESFVDPLTRLRTPMLLKRQLEQILESGFNRNLDLWVSLFTIDDYYRLKDEYGYVVMEKVLLFIAKSLQGTIRSENKIYRYNESPKNESVFCVVFNRMDKQNAYLAAGRVRVRVEASKLVYNEKVIAVTISAALAPHRIADTVESISFRAEAGLLATIANKKNAICVFDD
jgi:diguanylate cyclase (GGDEF)-like protein